MSLDLQHQHALLLVDIEYAEFSLERTITMNGFLKKERAIQSKKNDLIEQQNHATSQHTIDQMKKKAAELLEAIETQEVADGQT